MSQSNILDHLIEMNYFYKFGLDAVSCLKCASMIDSIALYECI